MDKKTPLSIAIITKNEEERLPACLESLSFASEVVVVDSGSSDDTVRIAELHGAKVFHEEWQGFSHQKQFAVDKCSNRWVLILDADERVPAETAERICNLVRCNDKDVAAYTLRRKNFLHGRWIKHCGWWPDTVLRLVDKTRGNFDGKPVHENWSTLHTVEDLDVCIEHLSFRNYSELVTKMERYSTLGAQDLMQRGGYTHVFKPASHGLWMFFKTFFLEKGFMDGFDGFVISVMNAGGSFLKYAKHRELQCLNRDGQQFSDK